MPNNSLFHHLTALRRRRATLPMDAKRRMWCDLLRALAFLHAQQPPVLHLDVKSLNLLVAADRRTLKLSDFGESRRVLDNGYVTRTAGTGTPQWLAPENIEAASYTTASDVYSSAIVAWELLTLLPPYPKLTAMAVVVAVLTRDERPEFPPATEETAAYVALMQRAWTRAPAERPTASELLNDLSV